MSGPSRRMPTPIDITTLASALAEHGVEYVVIGGAAMAFHGFPRMTKDIDLLLPVDAENNRRLLKALKSVPNSASALAALRPHYMDQGYSTSFEGDIAIDLLYVAASKKFDDLRDHIKQVKFDGVTVSTLDVDGMLISKETPREEDIPDRLKLQRLRNALFDQERQRRIANLPALKVDPAEAVRLLGDLAVAELDTAAGAVIDWKSLESRMIAIALGVRHLEENDVAAALCNHSPGAVLRGRQAAIRAEVRTASQAVHQLARSEDPPRE